ncbi:MAG: hypothetical protein ACJ74H_06380 [Thermoanaerobaculia bacterium]
MAEPPDSPHVVARWHRVAAETEKLLREHEQLMQKRVELCRRRADLFRDLLASARVFVEDASVVGQRQPSASTGTVASSSRSR